MNDESCPPLAGPDGASKKWTVWTVQFCTPVSTRSNVYDMSYFTAATRGHNLKPTQRRRLGQLFQKADTSWIVLTNRGYEVSVQGELHAVSLSLEGAVSELELIVLGNFRQGLPRSLKMMYVSDGVWGVNMADLVRRSREGLEAL